MPGRDGVLGKRGGVWLAATNYRLDWGTNMAVDAGSTGCVAIHRFVKVTRQCFKNAYSFSLKAVLSGSATWEPNALHD
jgi:hypothetical protein